MLLFRVSKEAKIELEEDEYVERFKPFMMDVVHEWTKGASFKDIIKMTDMFEVILKGLVPWCPGFCFTLTPISESLDVYCIL